MKATEIIKKNQQKNIEKCIQNTDCYSFFNLLTSPELLDTVDTQLPEHRERLYPPTVTLSMYISQVLSSDGSCQNAVNGYAVSRAFNGLTPCSTKTGAYCKSRQNLPLGMVSSVAKETGRLIAKRTPIGWHWRGRRVKLVDGTTIVMPDTPENQAVYPQHGNQKEGVGFPIARMVSVMCLGSGAVLGAALDSHKGKETGEHALLRQLMYCLETGDILLGDRYYASYWLLAALTAMGIDVVFGQHGARKTDFRKGERLGKKDHIVTWIKPASCPAWMTFEQYEEFPDTIRVRESRVNGTQLVTTLLSPKDAPKSALFALYKQRWHVELDLRNIKTTLGMESLRCKTPEMNEKEMWVYFLAYNLIRLLMCEAALRAEILPRLISFKHTLQIWLAWGRHAGSDSDDQQGYLFVLIAQRRVGNRSGRIEPRAVKKRPKAYPRLNQTRSLAREAVRRNGQAKRLK